jgi:hypothetical protein
LLSFNLVGDTLRTLNNPRQGRAVTELVELFGRSDNSGVKTLATMRNMASGIQGIEAVAQRLDEVRIGDRPCRSPPAGSPVPTGSSWRSSSGDVP